MHGAPSWACKPAKQGSLLCRASKRLLLLDYDGTLSPGGGSLGQRGPSPQILAVLHGLCADKANTVFIISGRGRQELRQWFSDVVRLAWACVCVCQGTEAD